MEASAAISEELEDGEIEDSVEDDEFYQPLERPTNAIPKTATSSPPSDQEDDDDDSSPDSDSDSGSLAFKKQKRKQKPKPRQPLPQHVKKKNSIWCNSLEEEILTNNLVKCDVDQTFSRNRDVESYDYRSIYDNRSSDNRSRYSDYSRYSNASKRRHDGQHIRKKQVGNKSSEDKGSPRVILELSTSIEDNEEAIAKDIANKLCEEKEDLILRSLQIIGKEPTIKLFNETRNIEANGGMMIMNGTRRRTPGGVFLFLLKTCESISREQKNLIFLLDRKIIAAEKRQKMKEHRKLAAARFKQLLANDDFPTLLSRTELAIKQLKERKLEEEASVPQSNEEVKNPPPSPATDGRENSDNEDPKSHLESKFSITEDVGDKLREKEGERVLTCYADDDIFGGDGESMEVV